MILKSNPNHSVILVVPPSSLLGLLKEKISEFGTAAPFPQWADLIPHAECEPLCVYRILPACIVGEHCCSLFPLESTLGFSKTTCYGQGLH